jgi:hypothetical protein
MPNSVSLSLRDGDGSSPRDPTARCARCGRTGTVARLTRHDTSPPGVDQFCDACWQPRRAELELLRIGTTWDVRSWAFVLEAVREVDDGVAEARASRRPTAKELAELTRFLREMAAEILRVAPEIDGPMPADVSEFVRRHHDPSSRRDR